MKYTNSYNISAEVKPFTDSGFIFTKLFLYEELGGEVAYGKCDLLLTSSNSDGEESIRLFDETTTGVINLEDGNPGGLIRTIPIFIYKKERNNNDAKIEFYCIGDKDFFITKRNEIRNIVLDKEGYEKEVGGWPITKESIESLYKGKSDIRVNSNILQDVKYDQTYETDYDACKKLCLGYKKNTVFCFGWEGLMLKDIIGDYNSFGKHEDKSITAYDDGILKDMTIYEGSDFCNTTPYNDIFDKRLLNNSANNSWEESEYNVDYSISKDFVVISNYDFSMIVDKDQAEFVSNILENKKYSESNMFMRMEITYTNKAPLYKIGDVVRYRANNRKTKFPFSLCLVQSNELLMISEGDGVADGDRNGFPYSWKVILLGLVKDGEILKDTVN